MLMTLFSVSLIKTLIYIMLEYIYIYISNQKKKKRSYILHLYFIGLMYINLWFSEITVRWGVVYSIILNKNHNRIIYYNIDKSEIKFQREFDNFSEEKKS